MLRHFMSDVQCEDSSRDNSTPYLSQVAAVLDVMGEASAKAQGLKTAITSGKSSQKSGKMRVAMEGGPAGRESETSLRRLCFLSNYPQTLPTNSIQALAWEILKLKT